MKEYDVYLYGMVLMTTSCLLQDSFPTPDSYAELKEKYFITGGETGTCATILSNLNVNVKMDGNHLGKTTYQPIKDFYNNKTVDITAMTNDQNYNGLQDLVIIDKNTRTCFGEFQRYFDDENNKKWNTPQKDHIKRSKVASIDPFFKEESILASQYCKELGKKYTTIDCKFDSEMHKYSEVNVISNEFIQNNYSDYNIQELFKLYTDNTNGLVIFTFGSKEILFGRKGEKTKKFLPYKVDVVSTLGAGDSFKAGVTYAILNDMNDLDIVKFASATAATAISVYPLPLNPPSLEKIYHLINDK